MSIDHFPSVRRLFCPYSTGTDIVISCVIGQQLPGLGFVTGPPIVLNANVLNDYKDLEKGTQQIHPK